MPFHEKTAWISLGSFVLVYGIYFWRVIDFGLAGEKGTFGFTPPLIGSVIALIVVQIVLNAVAAARSPKDATAPIDEREKEFALKASRNAFNATSAMLFVGCLAAGFGLPPFFVANGLFFVLVMGEIVRAASQIAYYRMGA